MNRPSYNLIKNVEITCGYNKTIFENIDNKFKIERYYDNILQQTEYTDKHKYYYLDKQSYTERELIDKLELIFCQPECVIEKYDTVNWNDSTYATLIDIVEYVSKKYIVVKRDGLCYYSFIYNNICVYIENNSDISKPYIEYKYVKSQININDLKAIKIAFNFLNKTRDYESNGGSNVLIF